MSVQHQNLYSVCKKILRLYRVFPALLLSFFFVLYSLAGPAGDHAMIPEDLSIELSSAPNILGSSFGPESIAITSDGTVILSRKDAYNGPLPEMTITLDMAALNRIYQVIHDNDFFNLTPEYNDPAIVDGDYARLVITVKRQTHTVRTVNIRVRAFDRIALAINREMPDGRRIIYNALHIKEYKEVEK